MDVVQDFEDILELFARHSVQYLIVGGLAFFYHAKPRFTKDIDLWIDSEHENVRRANCALEDFGSPSLMTIDEPDEILQLGVAPIGRSGTPKRRWPPYCSRRSSGSESTAARSTIGSASSSIRCWVDSRVS